jgi:hypothetical protein
MATLDRILISVHCEAKYPLARVTNLPKGVTNHNPLLLRFGEKACEKPHTFRFEKWWVEVDDFEDMARSCWDNNCPHSDPIDRWQFKMRNLMKKTKGWSWNVDAELRKTKETILSEFVLDKVAELNNSPPPQGFCGKKFRKKMEQLWRIEEIKARQGPGR